MFYCSLYAHTSHLHLPDLHKPSVSTQIYPVVDPNLASRRLEGFSLWLASWLMGGLLLPLELWCDANSSSLCWIVTPLARWRCHRALSSPMLVPVSIFLFFYLFLSPSYPHCGDEVSPLGVDCAYGHHEYLPVHAFSHTHTHTNLRTHTESTIWQRVEGYREQLDCHTHFIWSRLLIGLIDGSFSVLTNGQTQAGPW